MCVQLILLSQFSGWVGHECVGLEQNSDLFDAMWRDSSHIHFCPRTTGFIVWTHCAQEGCWSGDKQLGERVFEALQGGTTGALCAFEFQYWEQQFIPPSK